MSDLAYLVFQVAIRDEFGKSGIFHVEGPNIVNYCDAQRAVMAAYPTAQTILGAVLPIKEASHASIAA